MTKQELVDAITKGSNLSKKDSEAALNSFMDTVKTTLKKGDVVRLVGFGTFAVNDRPAREGRNPKTGEVVKIKASKSPKFKAGKALKEAIN